MDSVRYGQILEWHVIPFADTFRYFQHDNAPPHKAAVTLQLLESSQVSVLTWPPYSPDCNPIENIQAILKQKVRSRHPKTLLELEKAIEDVWANDPQISSSCKSVIESMPRRIKAFAASRGGFINYQFLCFMLIFLTSLIVQL